MHNYTICRCRCWIKNEFEMKYKKKRLPFAAAILIMLLLNDFPIHSINKIHLVHRNQNLNTRIEILFRSQLPNRRQSEKLHTSYHRLMLSCQSSAPCCLPFISIQTQFNVECHWMEVRSGGYLFVHASLANNASLIHFHSLLLATLFIWCERVNNKMVPFSRSDCWLAIEIEWLRPN